MKECEIEFAPGHALPLASLRLYKPETSRGKLWLLEAKFQSNLENTRRWDSQFCDMAEAMDTFSSNPWGPSRRKMEFSTRDRGEKITSTAAQIRDESELIDLLKIMKKKNWLNEESLSLCLAGMGINRVEYEKRSLPKDLSLSL